MGENRTLLAHEHLRKEAMWSALPLESGATCSIFIKHTLANCRLLRALDAQLLCRVSELGIRYMLQERTFSHAV